MIKVFKDRNEMLTVIKQNFDASDFQMIKRNIAYGLCVGYYNDGEMIGAGSISMYSNELHIYTFEISNEYKREGYGTEFYCELIERYDPSVVTLDPLDDNAEAFWKKLGFEEGKDEDGNVCYINFLM